MELPPRARRIHQASNTLPHHRGTTSACAENTPVGERGGRDLWNYLRVRGEYIASSFLQFSTVELPPRARRIRSCHETPLESLGTTSACAENTYNYPARSGVARNYLRVRGEYPFWCRIHQQRPELPPRARRILAHRNT